MIRFPRAFVYMTKNYNNKSKKYSYGRTAVVPGLSDGAGTEPSLEFGTFWVTAFMCP